MTACYRRSWMITIQIIRVTLSVGTLVELQLLVKYLIRLYQLNVFLSRIMYTLCILMVYVVMSNF